MRRCNQVDTGTVDTGYIDTIQFTQFQLTQTLTVQFRFCNQDTAVDKLAFHTNPLFTLHIDLFTNESFNRLGILLRSNDKNLVILHQYGIGRYDFNLLVAIVPDT